MHSSCAAVQCGFFKLRWFGCSFCVPVLNRLQQTVPVPGRFTSCGNHMSVMGWNNNSPTSHAAATRTSQASLRLSKSFLSCLPWQNCRYIVSSWFAAQCRFFRQLESTSMRLKRCQHLQSCANAKHSRMMTTTGMNVRNSRTARQISRDTTAKAMTASSFAAS